MDRDALINNLQHEGNLRHSFSPDEIESLAEHISIEVINEETMLMRKGEPSDNMVFILDGLVQVLDGDRQIALEKTGAILGESLFSDEATRVANVQAIEPTTIGRFSIHNFNTFLEKNQTLALRFREYFQAVGRARAAQIYPVKLCKAIIECYMMAKNDKQDEPENANAMMEGTDD